MGIFSVLGIKNHIKTWASFGGGQGEHVPPLLAVRDGDRISDVPPPSPPTLLVMEKKHLDYMFALYPYFDILSMYSIYRIRMRGNRN